MPKLRIQTDTPRKRTKLAQERRGAKLDQKVTRRKKTALKPNLSDFEAPADCLAKRLKVLTRLHVYELVHLNAAIDYYRTRWIEASKLRDKIRRSVNQ